MEMSMKKDQLIEMIFKEKAIEFGHFILSSGKESDYYINIKKLITNPKALRLIAFLIKAKTEELGLGYDKIAGPELGAVPIAVSLALETEKPILIVRKKKKSYGTGRQIEGVITPGDRVLLVEDVTTTGNSVLRAAKVLEGEGAKVVAIMVVVDREEGAKELLSREGYTLIPLVTVGELFEYKEKQRKDQK
ncbi:orotate phosphoribosyltransferase [Thermococcus litoralis DSM 5473]|uniref:Orotate phosphoribosyltransferase n=1 Tax=Thermococcus litoralis (strain ATCC 51850 / DSM 5473 / JCM 8560 / NS-C) TaxID=523849 RepID=H3ZLG7_THELN|nr:orotate phosphoribosyltransferase [Thermococcus litoralis DSM 5473]